jgi:hypothetical protein
MMLNLGKWHPKYESPWLIVKRAFHLWNHVLRVYSCVYTCFILLKWTLAIAL